MNEYTFTELINDINTLGIPLFEVGINNILQIKVCPNNFEVTEHGLSFWITDNKSHLLGLVTSIEQYECLAISKECKLYLCDKCIYHPNLECIKSINIYDVNDNFLGTLYYPTHLY